MKLEILKIGVILRDLINLVLCCVVLCCVMLCCVMLCLYRCYDLDRDGQVSIEELSQLIRGSLAVKMSLIQAVSQYRNNTTDNTTHHLVDTTQHTKTTHNTTQHNTYESIVS